MSTPFFSDLLRQAKKLHKQGHCEESLALFDDLLAQIPEAEMLPTSKQVRLRALAKRGEVLQGLGRQNRALANYHQYYLEAGGSKHAVRALVKIGGQQSLLGRHQEALQTIYEAKTLAVALNDTEGRANVHERLGVINGYLGRFEESLVELRKALALYEQLEDEAKVSTIWNGIGVSHSYLGEIDKANQAYSKGLSHDIDPKAKALLLLNLGENHLHLYSMEQALAYHREALPLVDAGSLAVRGDLLRNIGLELFYLGDEPEAIKNLYEGLSVSFQAKEQDLIFQALASIARIEAERGNWAVARQHAEQLLEEAEKQSVKGHITEAMFVFGLIEAGMGNVTLAEEYWQRGLFLAHETGKRFLLWQIHAGLADIAQSETLMKVHSQIAADIIKQVLYPIVDKSLRSSFLGAELVQKVLRNAGIPHLVP